MIQIFNIETLESLCIRSIIDNISLFCAAYHHEEYEGLQPYLELIQRKFANDLWKTLSSQSKIENEHIDFVVNKYVTELDFKIFQGSCDYLLVIEQLRKVGSAIIKMSMSGEKDYQTVNETISCLKSVQILELRSTKSSDDTLQIIVNNCPNIKSIDVKGCTHVTDKGLSYLESCNSLECLHIKNTSVSYKGVASLLKSVPSLLVLHYENFSRAILDTVGLNALVEEHSDYKGRFNLTSLYIDNDPMEPQSHLTLALRVCTTYCPNVKDLRVCNLVAKEQFELCCLFRDLETVSFGCSYLAANDWFDDFLYAKGANLKVLRLISFSLSVEVLTKCCPNLEYLYLEAPRYQPISGERYHSNTFPKLKILNLENVDKYLDIVPLLISASPNLEVFIFFKSFLSDDIQTAVSNTTAKLKVINLNGTFADMSYLQGVLRTHRTLEKLIIYNTNITAAEYDDLLDLADELQSEVDIMWCDNPRYSFYDYSRVRRRVTRFTNNYRLYANFFDLYSPVNEWFIEDTTELSSPMNLFTLLSIMFPGLLLTRGALYNK